MKQIIQRFLLWILIFSLLFITGCSKFINGSSAPAVTPSTNESNNSYESLESVTAHDSQNLLASFPDMDFQGREFRIATDDSSLFITSNNTSVVGKTKYLRNVAVEKKYNAKITLTDESGLPTITERLKTESLAGTDFCDLVILDSLQFSQLVLNDSLLNIRTVPYLELNQDAVHESSLAATTFGSYTYGFASDFLFQPENAFCVFFNKALLSQTSLPSIYDLVAENQWDFENFLLYSEEVYSVSRSLGNKISGFCSTKSSEGLISILWAASGQSFLSNEYGTRPYLDFDNEATNSFIQTTQKMLFSSIARDEDNTTAIQRFANGAAFFLIAPLSAAEEISKTNTNFGVVPLPKQDINQPQYYTYLNATSYAGFLKTTKDLNFAGTMTNALIAASNSMPQELSLSTYLNLYFNSSDDYRMMQMIISSPYYEAAEFFKQMDPSFSASTQTLLFRTISSEGRFSTLYTQYTKMFEKFLNTTF